MKLTVKNFGPIREAKNIDISPLTIFVGPSNTGKSYLAMLVYSIFKMFADEEYAWEMSRNIRRSHKNFPAIFGKLTKSHSTASAELVTCFSQWAQAISDVWKHNVAYCFGEEARNVIEEKSSNEVFSVVISDPENQLVLDLTAPTNSKLALRKRRELSRKIKLELSQLLADLIEDLDEEIPDQSSEIYQEIYESVMRRYYPEAIFQQFQASLFAGWQLESLTEAYYLPAVRGGIMQSHRTLVNTLIKRAPMAGLSRTPPVPAFNGVLSDFMTKLIDVESGRGGRMRPRRRLGVRQWRDKRPGNSLGNQVKMEKFGRSMEQLILSGEIDIHKSETGYPDFRYKFKEGNTGYDLPLMNASSSVSELAPVSLFIRYYVSPDDLFIVEEPEAHLHPAAQLKISDILVQLVNAGVNVLITTHSDNILEQITNFIYAADLPTSKKTKLDKEKCSVYLFKSGGRIKKTIVKKIPFDPEIGLLTQDHLDVTSALYNETIDLMEQIENVGS